MWKTFGLICVLALTAPTECREKVNFDFAWRFKLNPHTTPPPSPSPSPHPPLPPPSPNPPPNRLATCKNCKHGTNYGTGSISIIHTGTYDDCCTACAAQPECKAWDWNENGGQCYLKDNADTSQQEDRWSGIMPANVSVTVHPPSPPAPSPPAPESQPGFDDSAWLVVDAPHDMLINQDYNPANSKGMGYLARGSGWYRKHFALPAEWEGKSVWLYIEGAFHTTTAYMNGVKMGYHQAGYTSFWLRFDNVTGVKYGGAENVLALSLDATFGTGWWYEGGGLIRHNYLIATETTHLQPDSTWSYATDIAGIEATSAPASSLSAPVSNDAAVGATVGHFSAKSATVVTSAEVTNHGTAASSVTIKATITDDATGTVAGSSTSGAVTVPAGQTVVTKTSKQLADVNVWSVHSPSLYTVAVDVVSAASGDVLDSYNYSIGIRTIAFDTKGLHLNGENVKVRGFCDHSNFGGVGGAVPDRVNLYRSQMLRSVGGNSWRMAHNPPIPARLDFMDRLGMLALDENRDYGEVGDHDNEPLPAQLTDMRDLVKRDRSHPSVMAWSFCNEGECDVDEDAKPFRNVTYEFDGTRPVTQNRITSTGVATQWLDIQGFSHKSGKEFDSFHKSHPDKPMMATECCSCMSQRGVDQDACPSPADGGCDGGAAAGLGPGVFYNNNIGKCTAQQVIASDSRDFVAGTYIWSGFDYYGEARGFPQNTKCRGTVSDIAGFFKETSYWIRSWWLSNISDTDPGKPPLSWKPDVPNAKTTVFILETWQPRPAVYSKTNHTRTINVYTNAPGVRLQLNGKDITPVQKIEFFGQATFNNVPFSPGNLTAVAVDAKNVMLASHSVVTPTTTTGSIVLSLDAPSVATGTGTHVVADGEDVALVRATLLDSAGNFAADASDNVTFTIVSGPGRIWTTHNGDPADGSPRNASWNTAYHGLIRVFVRTTTDSATPLWHRQRMLQIDVDSGVGDSATVIGDDQQQDASASNDIVIKAEIAGASHISAATLTIPVSNDLSHLPMAVAAKSV